MDPGHHTAFLLAILVCILLLILAVSALMMCYCRQKCIKYPIWKSTLGLKRLRKDQATSMTSFTCNAVDPKPLIYNDSKNSQTMVSMPVIEGLKPQRDTLLTSCLSVDSIILSLSEDDDLQAAESTNTSAARKCVTSEQNSALNFILSSGASVFGSLGTLLSVKAKRRSSSMKSGVDSDIMLVPMESPVQVTHPAYGHFKTTSLPRELSRSTILCENSSDQPFTWTTGGLSIISSSCEHKEFSSVPGTLERKSCTSEEQELSRQGCAPLWNPSRPLQSNGLLGSFPRGTISDGTLVAKTEHNNVTSLDSGVDIIAAPLRLEDDALKREIDLKVACTKGMAGYIPCTKVVIMGNVKDDICGDDQTRKESKDMYLSHQEAAKKLSMAQNSRSVWQKREERPLIGVN